MNKLTTCGLAIAALLVAGCAGGAGGSATSGIVPQPVGGNNPQGKSSITFSIRIAAANSPQTRKPGFVSPGTQSLGIVETDQGASSANPAVFVNVSNCPAVSGVVTCTATVPANPGLDAFVMTSYSAANGGGSVLGSGSLQFQIQPGVNNTTTPLTINGAVASLVVTPYAGDLPLGQSEPLAIVAKDASGAVIAGAFSNAPITLSGTNLTFSKTSLSSSNDFSGLTVAFAHGYQSSWPTATIAATTADNVTGTAKVNPATGIALYDIGSNSNTDLTGFKIALGRDGKIYTTTLGLTTCTNSGCSSTGGAIHQFDPATYANTEISMGGFVTTPYLDTNNTLWIGGGTQNTVSYIVNANTSFANATPVTITLPTPAPISHTFVSPNVRSFAQDASNNIWTVDTQGRRLIKIPMTSPTTASVVTYRLPNGPAGTPAHVGGARNVVFYNGNLYVVDFENGVVDQFLLASNTWGAQTILPLKPSESLTNQPSYPYEAALSGSTLYVAQTDDGSGAMSLGGISAVDLSTGNTSVLSLPASVQSVPFGVSGSGNLVYYADNVTNALGVVDITTGKSRAWPVNVSGSVANNDLPGNALAMSDGTAWYTCYGAAYPTTAAPPACMGHTVYLSGWSVWPGYSVNVFGAGSQNATQIGIMENPASDSGPFTAASSNQSVCTTTAVNDHNFSVVGVAAGACMVTVTDKNGLSRVIQVSITTTSGTIQARKHQAIGGI